MTADLHLHTYYSDGNWSPAELVNAACERNFKVIALTDHDTVEGLNEFRLAAEAKIRTIDGIEFNTIWRNTKGIKQDVHILGYYIDPNAKALQDAIKLQQSARVEHINETLEAINAKGFNLSLQDVIDEAGKGSLGRPHICKAMVKKGVCKDVSNAYRMLLNRDSEYKIERRSITPEQAIEAIQSSGGIASLAHPGKDDFIPELVIELKKSRLDAIEAYHRGHTNSMVKKYLKMARENGLLVTGGSDCHGPFEDYPPTIGTVRLPLELVATLDANLKHRN